LKIDPPEALGPKPRVLGCQKLLRRVTREKLGRPTKFHQKSRIRSKVIQQSLGDRRTDGRTDRQTDRQMPFPPTPIRAGENFFLCKFSTIPLTTFARFARSLRSRNDKYKIKFKYYHLSFLFLIFEDIIGGTLKLSYGEIKGLFTRTVFICVAPCRATSRDKIRSNPICCRLSLATRSNR
jgi:hypothetical protein